MSEIACGVYGIDSKLFSKVVGTREMRDNAQGFARRYISGLHKYVSKLEAQVEAEKNKNKLLLDRIKDQKDMINLLMNRGNNQPRPSVPPLESQTPPENPKDAMEGEQQ